MPGRFTECKVNTSVNQFLKNSTNLLEISKIWTVLVACFCSCDSVGKESVETPWNLESSQTKHDISNEGKHEQRKAERHRGEKALFYISFAPSRF